MPLKVHTLKALSALRIALRVLLGREASRHLPRTSANGFCMKRMMKNPTP
jgi:hypothetical protein